MGAAGGQADPELLHRRPLLRREALRQRILRLLAGLVFCALAVIYRLLRVGGRG